MALLYGLGKTKITLAINFSRVFLFRIPILLILQNYTTLGAVSVGIVMMISNISVGLVAIVVAIWQLKKLKLKPIELVSN